MSSVYAYVINVSIGNLYYVSRESIILVYIIYSEWNDEEHVSTHEMKEITQDESHGYIDKDYTNFNPSLTDTHYNYLDPNFCPAL